MCVEGGCIPGPDYGVLMMIFGAFVIGISAFTPTPVVVTTTSFGYILMIQGFALFGWLVGIFGTIFWGRTER